MKRVLSLLFLGGLVAGCSSTPAHPSQPIDLSSSPSAPVGMSAYEAEPVPPTTSTTPAPDVTAQVDAVKRAKTPAAAMDAYSNGMAATRNSAVLQEAYIRKMVEFDLPQDAAGPARQLLQSAPDSGLARAVVAFDEARHGDLPDAVNDIVLSAQRSPNDPFVQQQAARILAWYDNTPHQPKLAATVQEQLPAVRKTLEEHKAYHDAYAQAADFYKQARETPAPTYGRLGPTTNPANAPAVRDYPSDQDLGDGGYYAPPTYEPGPYGYGYPDPYYYPAYAYPYYPYDYGYLGWSPFFFGADFLFFDHFYHHDHFRDHGHFGDHGHDGQHDFAGNGVVHSNTGTVRSNSGRTFGASRGFSGGMGGSHFGSSFSGGRGGFGGGGFSGGGHGGGGGGGHR